MCIRNDAECDDDHVVTVAGLKPPTRVIIKNPGMIITPTNVLYAHRPNHEPNATTIPSVHLPCSHPRHQDGALQSPIHSPSKAHVVRHSFNVLKKKKHNKRDTRRTNYRASSSHLPAPSLTSWITFSRACNANVEH